MKRIFLMCYLLLLCFDVWGQHHHHSADKQSQNAKTVIVDMPHARTIVYHLVISDTMVNYTGKARKAIAVNGRIPGPELHFTEGDTAEIHVHNMLDTETSVHWHGLILPNMVDGVPYLTTAPIMPHQTTVYKFPLLQSGTYWYHSHTKLQEQSGLYGALVIHKRQTESVREFVLLLSDWTDERPSEVHRSLRSGNDWYLIEKDAVQSYGEAVVSGYLGAKLKNEWKRMHAMDVSDVYYDALLANGGVQTQFPKVGAGERIRLRLINGSSSTYFWLQFAGGKLKVVSNDGMDVEPVEVDRMLIAVAETYDIELTIPDDMSYEFRATAEDRTKYTSLWLGEGMKMGVPALPVLDYFAGMKMMNSMVKMNGDLDDKGMNMSAQGMDMNEVMYRELQKDSSSDTQQQGQHADHNQHNITSSDISHITTLNYTMLRSKVKTTLDTAATWRELHFTLEGNMSHYMWTLDNKVVSESERILIRRGENVRIIMYNNSMMRHPMHLHGHFFRLLNGQGDYSPLKNVVDVMPMERDTIEFSASETGDWFFHCHILYHMMSGMGRVFSYRNSPANSDIDNIKHSYRKFLRDDRMIHPMLNLGVESNGISGGIMVSNTRYSLGADWHTGWNNDHEYKVDAYFGRHLGKMQHWFAYVGWSYRYNSMQMHDNRNTMVFGVSYTLPMLIVVDAQVGIHGGARVKFKREDIALTNRLRLDAEADTDGGYRFDARYVVTKYISFAGNYDSDMGWGAGLIFRF